MATETDVTPIADLGVRFAEERRAVKGLPVNWGCLASYIHTFLRRDDKLVLVYEDAGRIQGTLLAQFFGHPFSGEPTVYEVFFWVAPEHRGSGFRSVALLKAMEEWAIEKGAKLLQTTAPKGSKAGRLYEKRGYTEVETSYQRRVA